MITRSFASDFAVQDFTQELQMIPNIRTPLSDLGIFRSESVATTSVTFEETNGTLGLISDVHRGSAVLANKDETRKLHSYAIPYFKVVDYLTAADIQGVRAYGSADQAETQAAALERKMTRMKRSMQQTSEYAKFYAITQGKIYSPSGAVAHTSYYTDFGVSRKEIDFNLDSGTTDVLAKAEEAISHIQDSALSGDVYSGVVCLCSPEFFAALISHAKIVSSYQYYTSTQEPLRNRLGGNTTLHREFMWAGVLWREIRDAVNGTRFIGTDEAYFVPMNTQDTFVSYWAPSNKIALANTLGEEAYFFQSNDTKGEKIELELEFSQIHLLRRPQVVVKATRT